jgi:hypothetical protein
MSSVEKSVSKDAEYFGKMRDEKWEIKRAMQLVHLYS